MTRKLLFLLLISLGSGKAQHVKTGTIDRKQVVQRHNFHITAVDEPGPTQVGNGHFAFGFDVTGMQTFNDQFMTTSDQAWHTSPPPPGINPANFQVTEVPVRGRKIPYELPDAKNPLLSQWLAANPHKFNLGRIGLRLTKKDGTIATAKDIRHPDQHLDMWTAIAQSTFEIDGHKVKVTTVADPEENMVAFRIESSMIATGHLSVQIDFPYANVNMFSNGSDYAKPDRHTTAVRLTDRGVTFSRSMDSTRYQVDVVWNQSNKLVSDGSHRYRLCPLNGRIIEYVVRFDQGQPKRALPSFSAVKAHSAAYWPSFWNSGGFVDLSGSRDSRWKELERRLVLSQYAMKINASGDYPPQETGLVSNSWYGRFHSEMILWNTAHFALWNRWEALYPSLNVFRDNLRNAEARAALQGYAGTRYAKCTGPDGREWPHPIHAFLVWQQPHPIFFALLDYRAHPTKSTLNRWLPIIEPAADFLASFTEYDSLRECYFLGPPIAFMPENNDFYHDRNPAFELGYWRFGLRTAQWLRKQAELPEKKSWTNVSNNLAPIPSSDQLYVQWENVDSMWTRFNFEHPALLGVYGLLPGDGVDVPTMNRTFDKVKDSWRWDSCWGWDFPMAAMTAARLGKTKDALDMLLHTSPKNGYDRHGFVGGGNPYPYFPANGSLLYAVALMVAGWDGDEGKPEPGFPKDGSWTVRWEGLQKAP